MGFIDDQRSVSAVPIKPRRAKGTYAYRVRNYFATAVILGGSILGIAWMFLPNTAAIRKSVEANLWSNPEDNEARSYKIRPFGGAQTSVDVERLLKDLGRDVDEAPEKKEKAPEK